MYVKISYPFVNFRLDFSLRSIRQYFEQAGRKIEITFNLWHTTKHFLLTLKTGETI